MAAIEIRQNSSVETARPFHWALAVRDTLTPTLSRGERGLSVQVFISIGFRIAISCLSTPVGAPRDRDKPQSAQTIER
ncbi:hypothetical protein BVL52_00780 [Pseudomonas oryzihabitans]|uniref:Uncharacterized protein n=1 Tax=Pseudomonas oryzihabitans TaxID=47885 RepID=A0ABX3IY83_9PSED|nr:hypothetical protein BVL52_00780 [Pseudomonas psychrotolerans]